MKIHLIITFVALLCITCHMNDARKDVNTKFDNNYYENYDDDPLDDLDLDDDMGSDLNVIGRDDQLRQIILNPRKRRERRRKHQGNFSINLNE